MAMYRISTIRPKLKNRSLRIYLDCNLEKLLHSKFFCNYSVGGTTPGSVLWVTNLACAPLSCGTWFVRGLPGPIISK